MRCSKIVGTIVVPEEAVILKVVNDEKFLEVEVEIEGVRYPGMISEFLLQEAGKHQIDYYLRSESRNEKLFTCLSIVACEKVEEDTPDTNCCEIYGYISKVFPMKVKKRKSESVKMVGVRYFSDDKNVNLAHCVGFKELSRKLNTMKENDNVLLLGKLQMNKSIEVVVEKVMIHRPAPAQTVK